MKFLPVMMSLKKYLQVFKMSWQNTLVYRLNFVMWRVRSVILRLSAYFFWFAVYRFNRSIGSYNENMMLTYILVSSFLDAFVLASRSFQVAGDISTGNLSNYLIKPIKYFGWMIFLDLGDKASNLFFLFFETIAIFILLKPPFFLQTDPLYLFYFFLAAFMSVIIFFYLSLLISLTTFWYPEYNGWPMRFLFITLLYFLAGSMVPLDLLPNLIYKILSILPPAYFIFFPLQVYLGKISSVLALQGLAVMVFWVFSLHLAVDLVWKKGIKKYSAVGI